MDTSQALTPAAAHPQDEALALRHLDALLACAPFGFVFLDRALRFVRISQRLAEVNGYSVAAHIGKTVAEIAPKLEATLRDVTQQIVATGQPVLDHAFTGETADAPGVSRTWNQSWYPVRDEHDAIIGFSATVVDITERMQAEAALRLQNERFALAVKASQAVLWQQDTALRFTWLHNPAPGIDGSNAVGKTEADLLERAEDVAVIEGLKREVMRSGVGMRTEFFPHIQGVVHCFELLMEPLRDAAGQITGLTGAAIDITERKKAEAAQRESDRYYRALAEASLEIPYRMSADWSTMQALDGGDLVASSDSPLSDWAWLQQNLPRDEHARVRQAIGDAINRQGLFEMEHRVLRPDGSSAWTLSRAVPIFDETEGLVAWFGVASDITQRKQAEEAVLEGELHFQALAEASAEIPYRMSADWSTMLPLDGRGLFSSSESPVAEWAWVYQYLPSDEHARVRQVVEDAIAQKKLFTMEHRVLRSDGSIGWVRSRAVPILNNSEELVAWFGAARDITERKEIEQNLIEATAAAEKANRAKSDFLSCMSHELRTPLNSILGFAQLIENGVPAPTPIQRKNIEHILKGGWYLLDLVNELLDLVQIESGRLSLNQEAVALTEVVRECRDLVEPQARERAINLVFPSLMLPRYVWADRTRLKQVLINLLSNAIKYKAAQGTVHVELTLRPQDSVRLSVRDTGGGLTPEQLSQLFQPFNRLGMEESPIQGTGIGLITSKRLVELMGGTIGAESVVGVGSVFWFELKWAPP